jgi:HEAT repeat protein
MEHCTSDLLAEETEVETDRAMQADILHLLGQMKHPAALGLARKALLNADADLRRRACHVLGWMGQRQDIAPLGEVLRNDADASVRRTAATSHHPFFEHANGNAIFCCAIFIRRC